jgi:hypothetical protein
MIHTDIKEMERFKAVTNRWRWQVKVKFKNDFAGRQVVTG